MYFLFNFKIMICLPMQNPFIFYASRFHNSTAKIISDLLRFFLKNINISGKISGYY